MLAPRTSTTTATMWPPLSMAEPDVCAPIDANGNLTGDGTRSLGWDANNQLVSGAVGVSQVQFTYDGSLRRVRAVEVNNGSTSRDSDVVWCDSVVCEERTHGTGTVERRRLGLGDQVSSNPQYFHRDHLGSVETVTDGTAAVAARYTFDAWGRRQLVQGSDVTRVGFTGHEVGSNLDLLYTMYRSFDSDLGRWISEDPSGMRDGPNLYSYVTNKPTKLIDPLGLCGCNDECPSGRWFMSTATAGGGAPGGIFLKGFALLRCDGKPFVFRTANISCALLGAINSVGASISLNWRDPKDLGACNRKDLTPFKTQLEYYVDFGPVQVAHGVIGFGVGFGRGIGYLTCSVTPR